MVSFRERMLGSREGHGSRIVMALDFSGPYEHRLEKALSVLEATKKKIAAVKLNHHLLLPYGLEGTRDIVRVCKDEGLPLIADLKMNDIESTNLNIVGSLMDYGLDAVIANPFVGKAEGLGKVIEALHSRESGIILLVYMSHAGAAEGYGLEVAGEPMYLNFARRAKEWGADGVVVSAKDRSKIEDARRVVGSGCLIFSPGVGAQGGDIRAGAGGGADFIIVGRSLTEAPDPAEALRVLNGP